MKKLLKTIPFVIFGILLSVITANAAIAGDINDNGKPDIEDARIVLRQAIGLKNSELTDTMIDMTDYNYDGITDIYDAKEILNIAVGTGETKHYFSKEITVAPTCTDDGLCTRICTECDKEKSFTQKIQPTGHKLSSTPYKTVKKPTCSEEGTVKYKCKVCKEIIEQTEFAEHKWKDATCTKPMTCKVCKTTVGTATGHSVKVGYCSECGKYVAELESQSNTIISYLNSALKHIKNAQELIDDGAESQFTNVLIEKWTQATEEIKLAETDFTDAFNTCFEETDFSAAKTIIKKMVGTTSDVIVNLNSSIQNINKIETDYKPIIKKTPSKVSEKNKKILAAVNKSLVNTDNYFEEINTTKYDLKAQTDKWKKQ